MEPSVPLSLTLEALQESHWPEVFAMTSLPSVGGNLRYGAHREPEEAKELIRVLTTAPNRGFALLAGEVVVGVCAYKGAGSQEAVCGEEGVRECHLTIFLHPDHWGRGYSTGAIGELLALSKGEGYTHMVAYVREDNVGSCRMLEKNAFIRVHSFPNDEGDGCPVHIYRVAL